MAGRQPSNTEVEISQILLYTPTGRPIDLYEENLFNHFCIYESIDLPFMYGYIEINDIMGISEFLPIYGNEYIDIKFRSNDETPWIDMKFWVYDSGKDKQLTGTHQVQNRNIRLFFITRPQKYELSEHFSLTFKDKKYHEIVTSVVEDLLRGSMNETDPTPEKITLATNYRWRPKDIIEYCIKKSVSQQHNDTGYIFFENPDGFNYVSLSFLLSKSKQHDMFINMTHDRKNLKPIVSFQKVARYNFIENSDIMRSMVNKKFGGSYHVFYPDGKHFDEVKHQFDSSYLDTTWTMGTNSTSDQEFSLPDSFHMYYTGASKEGASIRLRNFSRFTMMEDYAMEVFITGHSGRYSGHIVNLEFPSKESTQQLNKQLDGHWIIRSVEHKVSHTKNYMNRIVMVKDTFKNDDFSRTFNTGSKVNPGGSQ